MAILRGVPGVEKKVVAAALLFAAAQLALIGYAAAKLGLSVPGCVTTVKPFSTGELILVAPGRYEAHVVAKMWEFDPAVIRVPKGSVVDFYVTSLDVIHGFHIHGTNVNLMALPAAVNYAQATFREPGTFPVVCHEYCGAGHQQMAAAIEVVP